MSLNVKLLSLLIPCFLSCQKTQIGNAVVVKSLPEKAEIIFHKNGFIYAMDRNGTDAAQLTFGTPHRWEHVAVSPDHRYIVGNEQLPNYNSVAGGKSKLWVYDLARGTETKLLQTFLTAGNGGVDWDREGFIYFCGKEKDPYPQPSQPSEWMANAGANDIYRVKPDGSQLQRLLESPGQGECDVSVSEDGKLIAYGTLILETNSSEIWMAASDGSSSRMVYRGGPLPDGLVADPELSPDNNYMVFSHVNTKVPPNFPNNPDANTAHDIWSVKVDGKDFLRLTAPGPISIAPDWHENLIVYLCISEHDNVASTALIKPNLPDQLPFRLLKGSNIAKWY